MTKPSLTHYFHSIAIDKENKHLLFSLRQGPNLYPFFQTIHEIKLFKETWIMHYDKRAFNSRFGLECIFRSTQPLADCEVTVVVIKVSES